MVDAVMPFDGTGSNCIDCRTALVVCGYCGGEGVVPIRCQNGPCGRDAVVSFGGLALCGACAVAAGWTPDGGARAVAMTGRHGADSGMVADSIGAAEPARTSGDEPIRPQDGRP